MRHLFRFYFVKIINYTKIYNNIFGILFIYMNIFFGDWGLGMGIGDWGFGALPQTPTPQTPTPTPKKKLN